MTDEPSLPGDRQARVLDTTVPHSARIWNYWLGGKDNYPVDREMGDQILAVLPDVGDLARASRACLGRIVRYLAGEAGIRQFLDVGTGLPTAGNTHEVAQAIAPESHIVYVDNDPLVLVHAEALLIGTREGTTDYIEADLRDPGKILAEATRTLDFEKPIAVILMGIMHHVVDDDQAQAVVDQLVGDLPSGSYLAISHATNVVHGERTDEIVRQWNETGGEPILIRTPEEIGAFCTGLELVEPGVASVSQWRPDPTEVGEARDVDEFCVVARKP